MKVWLASFTWLPEGMPGKWQHHWRYTPGASTALRLLHWRACNSRVCCLRGCPTAHGSLHESLWSLLLFAAVPGRRCVCDTLCGLGRVEKAGILASRSSRFSTLRPRVCSLAGSLARRGGGRASVPAHLPPHPPILSKCATCRICSGIFDCPPYQSKEKGEDWELRSYEAGQPDAIAAAWSLSFPKREVA